MTIGTETATELNLENTTKIARLYKFKNARVSKALSFTTKINMAKMIYYNIH
jgi:predicted membrane protein